MGYAYDYIEPKDPNLNKFVNGLKQLFEQGGFTVVPNILSAPSKNKSIETSNTHGKYPTQDVLSAGVQNPENKRSVTITFNGHSMLADGYMPTGEEYTVTVSADNKKIMKETVLINAPIGSIIGMFEKDYADRIPDNLDTFSKVTALRIGAGLDNKAYVGMQGAPFDNTKEFVETLSSYLKDNKSLDEQTLSLDN